MDKVFFMNGVLRSISNGRFFRNAFSITLKVFAILGVIGALVSWVVMWQGARYIQGAAVLGLIVFQALYVVTSYCVFHVVWIRANDIAKLTDSEFVAIPIVAIFVKMIGDDLACLFVGLGVASGVMMWFGVPGFMPRELARLGLYNLYPILGEATGGVGFLAGLLLMIACAVWAFLVLVTAYFISEQLRVLVDIAINTKSLRSSSQPGIDPSIRAPQMPSPQPPTGVAPSSGQGTVYCPGCATKNERSAYFCVKCGYKLGE